MAPLREDWGHGLAGRGTLSSLGAKLAFPLITAALVLLLGTAVFGLVS